MPEVSFHVRLLVLLGFVAVVVGVDRWRKGPEAKRWREYGYLLMVGALGGLVGSGLSQLSVTLSPDYYLLGKGIPATDNLRLEVAYMGFQAGLLAGVVTGGALLLAGGEAAGAALWRSLVCPLAGAVLLAPVGFLVGPFDPLGLEADLAGLITDRQVAAFLRVWGMHCGVYLGALVGLVVGATRIRSAGTAPDPTG